MQLVQSSMMGAALTMLGLVIQGRLDRRRPPAPAGPRTILGDRSADRRFLTDQGRWRRLRRLDGHPGPDPLDARLHPLRPAGPVATEEARSSTLGRT